MQYPASMQPTHARIEQVAPEDEEATRGSVVFPPVSHKMAKNFYIADTYLETPPTGIAPTAYDQNDPTDLLASFNSLEAVSDDIKDLLPPQCREAFDKAVHNEKQWKDRWGPESKTMSRREPIIDKAIVPYSMA